LRPAAGRGSQHEGKAGTELILFETSESRLTTKVNELLTNLSPAPPGVSSALKEEDKRVKQGLAIGLLAAALAAAAPSFASAGSRDCNVLPADAIATSVLSVGLFPSTHPIRRGLFYVLNAVDPVGGEVRVAADAQLGDVVSVLPIYRLGAYYSGLSASPRIIHVPEDEQGGDGGR
jgi:hypothetical protein